MLSFELVTVFPVCNLAAVSHITPIVPFPCSVVLTCRLSPSPLNNHSVARWHWQLHKLLPLCLWGLFVISPLHAAHLLCKGKNRFVLGWLLLVLYKPQWKAAYRILCFRGTFAYNTSLPPSLPLSLSLTPSLPLSISLSLSLFATLFCLTNTGWQYSIFF